MYNNFVLRSRKTETLFTGGRTFQVGSLGQDIFPLSGGKNDPKKYKSLQKIWCFLQKIFGKIFWIIFKSF